MNNQSLHDDLQRRIIQEILRRQRPKPPQPFWGLFEDGLDYRADAPADRAPVRPVAYTVNGVPFTTTLEKE